MFSTYSIVTPLYIFSISKLHTVYTFHLVGEQMSNAFAPAAAIFPKGAQQGFFSLFLWPASLASNSLSTLPTGPLDTGICLTPVLGRF